VDILPLTGAGRNVAAAAPPSPRASALDKPLFDAVQAHGLRTRGLPAHQVTISYADGSAVTIPVPIEPATLAASFWPRPEGWDFRSGEAAFNGIRFKVSGLRMAALRALAKTPGCPVRVEQLVREAWGEEPARVEPGTVHAQLSGLRRLLRTAFSMPANIDPIPHLDGAYTLAVGVADLERRAA
jgi:hypothetical protein